MQMKQCPNGHFYDVSKTPSCPYCKPQPMPGAYQAPGQPAYQPPVQPAYQPAPVPPAGADGATVPIIQQQAPVSMNDKTVAMIKHEIGADPVVGWLVCVDGSQKGRDYRLHADNNFIGRDPSMDVCINDETVTRLKHAIVSYDEADGTFYISAADGRSIVRHNGEALFGTAKLAAYDDLTIGSLKLKFVPMCVTGTFSWKD